ncbi:HNH endonuclease signature motif containing protein [Shewanella acanthi]|uniref:HNH endonuclease signature motif containing protein n=1 Tax=Shewanella acanthi TaxID=2864212 RepID=UPI001C65F253|nr:HNH endonuclease signature motif containing protein [Shewanella acanthi]QYJ79397.1 HNH endonuclease [Shewanella acanthi]
MPRFKYTTEMLNFLRDTYAKKSLADTAALFNRAFGLDKSESQLKAAFSNYGITCGRKKGELTKGNLRSVTQTQFDWVKKQYTLLTIEQLTVAFNEKFATEKTVNQIRALTRNHGMKSGRTGRFHAGQKSWNAGMKGYQAGGNSAATRFKKGNNPHNHKPVGSERIDNKDGFVLVKTAEPRTWRLKHIIEWEKHHGSVPADHKIWFIDNDRTNCDISNLMLVTTGEHAVVNKMGLGRANPDAKETVLLLARIKMAATKRKGDCHV